LGFGTTFKPSEAVVYHYHISDKKNDRIYVLLTELQEKEPRLHIFPYSKELKEQLDKADGEARQGVVVFGKFRPKDSKIGKVTDNVDWLFYNMPPNEIFPKEGG
jgi:histidyl-tRNA synthetase